jgi:DNA-binding MarR family transcriptional regulator
VTKNPFETDANNLARRVTVGLTKVAIALRSQSWQDAGTAGLSPTQGKILSLLRSHTSAGIRLSTVAQELAVTPATASDAVAALEEKGFVKKKRAEDDRRAIAITLTPSGIEQANQVSGWSDFLKLAVEELSLDEQRVFLQGLITIILKLQEQGQIPVARMCLTCQYFRPHVHDSDSHPHHCAFVDAPFGDQHLQVDCPDHIPKESS